VIAGQKAGARKGQRWRHALGNGHCECTVDEREVS
jgi:hypothetical protein